MIDLIEVAERARSGPRLSEKEWNMALFRKMEALVDEYDLGRGGGEEFINTDDSLADDAFGAAIDFVLDMGAYCITTNRVIRFEEDEVRRAIGEVPRQVRMGEGKDVRIFGQGKVDGSDPLNIVPGHHAPFTTDLAPLVVKNFAQIARADFIEGFNFSTIEGREVYGMPMEAYAAKRELGMMREGVRMAGRPGMAVVLYPISTRASSLIAPIDPEGGLRRTDGVLLSVLPDVKVEYDLLTAAIVSSDYGFFGVNGSFGMAGGFCGGPEGAMIEGIVKPIIGSMVYYDSIHYTGVEHLASIQGERIVLGRVNWARSVVYQALNRNSNTIYMEWNITCSELCTPMCLQESAMRSIEAAVNGANLYAPRVSRPRMNAGQTPLEAEWMVEVSDATLKAGLRREEAGEILRKMAEILKDRTPAKGKTIQECYDLVKHKPSEEYQAIYRKVKQELAELGLEFR